MKKIYLGEFEELTLTVVAILEKAYGNAIVKEMMDKLKREVNLSADM